MLRLLAEDLRREIAELLAEARLELLALGAFGFAFLVALLPQSRDFGLRRGAQGREFHLRAAALFGEGLHLLLEALAELPLGGRRLLGRRRAGFGSEEPRGRVALAGFGFGGCRAQASRVAEPEDQHQNDCRKGGCEKEKRGKGHETDVICCIFHKCTIFPEKHSLPGGRKAPQKGGKTFFSEFVPRGRGNPAKFYTFVFKIENL